MSCVVEGQFPVRMESVSIYTQSIRSIGNRRNKINTKNLSVTKKIIFSLITMVIFFLLIEIAARSYQCIKYKEIAPLFYGWRFIKARIKEPNPFKTPPVYEYAKGRESANLAFQERHTRNVPLPNLKPGKTMYSGYVAYINKYGFRNKDIELVKPDDVFRIMAIGGSFVACVDVADEDTWEVLLEKRLQGLPGKRDYEVINLGGGGRNIDHTLSALIDEAVKFNPDCVIIFSAYNNHSMLNATQKQTLSWKISNILYDVSLFYAMLREKLSLTLYKDNNYYLYNYNLIISEASVDSLMSFYGKRLEEIHTVCRENGIKLILGLQPEFIPLGLKNLQHIGDEKEMKKLDKKIRQKKQLSYYEFEYYVQSRFNLEMEKIAKKKNISLFDGVSIFPENKYAYFHDQIHLSPKGTALLAETLYQFLLKNNIIVYD